MICRCGKFQVYVRVKDLIELVIKGFRVKRVSQT